MELEPPEQQICLWEASRAAILLVESLPSSNSTQQFCFWACGETPEQQICLWEAFGRRMSQMSKCPNVQDVQDVRDLRPRIPNAGEVGANTLSVRTAWLRLLAFPKMLAQLGSRLVRLTGSPGTNLKSLALHQSVEGRPPSVFQPSVDWCRANRFK